MSTPFALMEGYYIDDANNIIGSIYVDLRPADGRTSIATLAKCCKQQHAIESCMNILISKPTRFRKYGEGLVKDPFEAKSSNTKIISETINNMDDLANAHTIDDEIVRAGRCLQYPMKIQTHSTKTRRTKTESVSTDKNGWIFCISIEPENQEENNEWRQSMPDGYDHVTHSAGQNVSHTLYMYMCLKKPCNSKMNLRHLVNNFYFSRYDSNTLNY